MEKRFAFSPTVDCYDTFQESCAPDWYCIFKIAVRNILALVFILAVYFSVIPAHAAESSSVSSGDVMSIEDKAGFYSVAAPDGAVVYVPESAVNYIVFQNTAGNYYTVTTASSLFICSTSYSDKTLCTDSARFDVYDINGNSVTYRYGASTCEHGRSAATYSGLKEYFGTINIIVGGNYQYCESETGGDIDNGDVEGPGDDSEGSGEIPINPNPESYLYPLYDSYEEFMESPLYVSRYENEILNKLEYIQYAYAIDIALLFLLIFKKK